MCLGTLPVASTSAAYKPTIPFLFQLRYAAAVCFAKYVTTNHIFRNIKPLMLSLLGAKLIVDARVLTFARCLTVNWGIGLSIIRRM